MKYTHLINIMVFGLIHIRKIFGIFFLVVICELGLWQINQEASTNAMFYTNQSMDEECNIIRQTVTYANESLSNANEDHLVQIVENVLSSGKKSKNTADTSNKTILFWNPLFKLMDYGIGLGTEALKQHNCPMFQCNLTADRAHMDKADAVIIHGFIFHEQDKPTRTRADQIFVFYIYENPLLTRKLTKLENFNDMFNLTFSYLNDVDTDIFLMPSVIHKKYEADPSLVPSIDLVDSKTRAVLWIVSNCHPDTARMEYTKQLSQFILVDTYGACGNLSCPGGSRKNNASCLAMLSERYWFYLAFENSFCQDYYTEKVWNPLQHGMIPITMGGANYSNYLPPNSHIDVQDFNSPKDLSDRLHYLMGNPEEYMEYFHWHRDYYIERWQRPRGFCELCQILHTADYPYKAKFNIDQYWNPDKLCRNKTEHMNMLHLQKP